MALPLALILGWAVIGNVSRHLEIAEDRVAPGAENRTTIVTAASMLEFLEPLEDGILLAGQSARISVPQLERLASLGKLPCVADVDQASALARELDLSEPRPEQLVCD